MESKLKALKVVDLKDILSKANVTVSGRANKQDLIAKILAAPEAIDVYNQLHGPAPAAKQPPPPAQPSVPAAPTPQATAPASPKRQPPPPAARPPSPAKPAPQAAAPPPTSASSPPASISASAAKSAEDEEAEKRKARAARFGIPLVEPQPPVSQTTRAGKASKTSGVAPADDVEKLAARAARFGLKTAPEPTPKANGKKRDSAAAEVVDPEELERRKKRAERFGTTPVGANA